MKRFSVLSLFAICLCLFLIEISGPSSAQQGPYQRVQKQDRSDEELARTIRQLTRRSMEGLIERHRPGQTGIDLDLEGRFQEVPVVKLDQEGDPAVRCVSTIEEANQFFGRDLESGERYEIDQAEAEYLATKRAARREMTAEEFSFYKGLAEYVTVDQLSPGSANIAIVNGDGPNEGFNDTTAVAPEGGNTGTTLGQQRLILFNHAASIWGAFLDSTVTININSKFDPLTPCSSSGGVLGSAGATTISRDFAGAEHPQTWYPVSLRNKIVGVDNNPSAAEINATFNSSIDTGCLGAGTRFYYGLDNATPSGRVNLLVVLLHEMGHGLGFQTFASGSTGALNGGYIDVFARHMFDRTANKFWGNMTDAERQASALNNGNLMFAGGNVSGSSAYLTNGLDTSNGHVQLYAPTTLQSGSSLSHFDKAAFPNLLMEPSITAGLPLDLDLTRQQMRDIGWFRDADGDRVPDSITNVLTDGATLAPGSVAAVTWTNPPGFARNVTIELSTDGGITFPTVLASNISNIGTYAFTVPNVTTTKGRIRVREHDFTAPTGVSGSDFTIASEPADIDITGQVFTSGGLGLRNATVSLIDDLAGSRITVSTSSLGFYVFPDIPTGRSYTLTVNSRRYRFVSRNIVTSSNLGPVDFVGIE